ncbi:MerR family transcriptional regulator [Streptomyces sp. NPDC000594]|uniref:MerR family transcriptional regulator n=1 Tax=Streptomyces sp. NPDC000594 TaxID=3154261 RepID=UPI00331DBE0D
MRIGEAATASGLTPRALRYYEQRGLLTAGRTPSGHRDYGVREIERLRVVRALLDTGLTIGDVRDVVHVFDRDPRPGGAEPVAAGEVRCPVAEVTGRRVAELNDRIDRLTMARDRLSRALTEHFEGLFSCGGPPPAA